MLNETENKPEESKPEKSLIITAGEYERVGKRTHLTDTKETRELLLDDTYKVIEQNLDKEGHTGFLSNKDGITWTKPVWYRNFFIQCFGYNHFESDLDIYGKMVWYGFARMEKKIADRVDRFEFAAHDKSSEHEAGRELYLLVDAYYGDGRRGN